MKKYIPLSERRFSDCYRCKVGAIQDVEVEETVIEPIVGVNGIVTKKLIPIRLKASDVVGKLKKSDFELENLIAAGALDGLRPLKQSLSSLEMTDHLESQLGYLPNPEEFLAAVSQPQVDSPVENNEIKTEE